MAAYWSSDNADDGRGKKRSMTPESMVGRRHPRISEVPGQSNQVYFSRTSLFGVLAVPGWCDGEDLSRRSATRLVVMRGVTSVARWLT